MREKLRTQNQNQHCIILWNVIVESEAEHARNAEQSDEILTTSTG